MKNNIAAIESQPQNNEAGKNGIEQLKDFPPEIIEAFNELPEYVRKAIFPRNEEEEKELEQSRFWKKLFRGQDYVPDKEEVREFSQEEKERFALTCFSNLLQYTKFRPHSLLYGADDPKKLEELKPEIKRLLDTLWQNRGKNSQDIKLFMQERYDEFFKKEKEINEELIKTEKEIARFSDVAHSRKNKPKGGKKVMQNTETRLIELYDKQKDLKEKLRDLKEKYGDIKGKEFWDTVGSNQREEKNWTEGLAIASQYIDADSFAVVAMESLEEAFYREVDLSQNPDAKISLGIYGRRKPSERELELAKSANDSIQEAVNFWPSQHQGEGPIAVDIGKTQFYLVDQFKRLMDSYNTAKGRGDSPEEINSRFSDMGAVLNVLNKISK